MIEVARCTEAPLTDNDVLISAQHIKHFNDISQSDDNDVHERLSQ